MKREYKLMIVLLAILGVGDLVMVPFMIAANHHTAGTPPMPAVIVAALIGIATLISAFGVARGLRWAFWVAMTCRIIDFLTSFLGLTNHPSAVLTVGGGLGVVLSIPVIVLLVRLNPRRGGRGARPRRRRTAGSRNPRAHPCSDRPPGPPTRRHWGRASSAGPARPWTQRRSNGPFEILLTLNDFDLARK